MFINCRRIATTLFWCLIATPVFAQDLASSFAKFPLKDWDRLRMDQRVQISRELGNANGLRSNTYINACMKTLAGDIRFENRPMKEAFDACIESGKRDGE